MRVLVYSKATIEAESPYPAAHLIVSVSTPGRDGAQPEPVALPIGEATRGVLRVEFHDLPYMPKDVESQVFSAEPHLVASVFTREHAARIADFVLPWIDQVEAVLVQCDAGMSRSPAVAAAIDKAVNGDDAYWFKRYHPNSRVYSILLEELMSRLGHGGGAP